MNKPAMEKLAAYIENLAPEKVDMSHWFGTEFLTSKIFCESDVQTICGTSACIAGWQVLISGLCLNELGGVFWEGDPDNCLGDAMDVAAKQLDLNYTEVNALILSEWLATRVSAG